jgi:hypothetical protein
VAAGVSFPYPSLTAVLFAPFALLHPGLAAVLFTVLCIAAVLGTLWVLSVKDWRLYGLVLLFSPVVIGWQTGNATLVMALVLALVWRRRSHAALTGLLVALLVCVKPIAIPLGLWLLATRRYAAAAWALGFGVVQSQIAWAVVGFGEIADWLRLLSVQGDLLYRKGYGLVALGADAGLGRGGGMALAAAVTCALAVLCVLDGRRGRDLAAFTIAVVMMITISPQVDEHYFVLLLVPLAIARPQLEPIWFVSLLLWPARTSHRDLWQVVLFWIVVTVVGVACVRSDASPAGTLVRSQAAGAGRPRPKIA